MRRRVWKKVLVSEAVKEIWTCPACRRESFREKCRCGVIKTGYLEWRKNRDYQLLNLGHLFK